MKDMLRKMFTLSIFSSIILIVIGLLLFLKPDGALKTLAYVIGGLILVFGIFGVARFSKSEKKGLNFDLVYAILSFIAGLIIIVNYETLMSIIPIVLGIWIIINSAIKIQYSFYIKSDNSKKWVATLVMSLITLICGMILLFNPFEIVKTVTRVVGLFIIIYAVIDLIESFMLKTKNNVKTAEVVVVDNTDISK